MKPGRELDALVAEKVFGHIVFKNKKGGWSLGEPDYYDQYGEMCLFNPLPEYSTEISAAWEVVDHLKDKTYTNGPYTTSSFFELEYFNGSWVAKFKKPIPVKENDSLLGVGHSENPTTAICLAALVALNVVEATI